MAFPLTSAADLPRVGDNREDLRLDLKGTVDPNKGFELAKDVAAFANSVGGVILVGAYEGAKDTLGRYAPMLEPEAAAIRDAYNKAVRDRCGPAPVLDAVLIPVESGWVVAVNVWPFPAQPVGVSTRDTRGGPSDHGWAFPVRTGTHTVFLKPEQIPMLMAPETRRVAILLEQVPASRRAKVQIFWREYASSGPYFEERHLTLKGVRAMENVALFENVNRHETMYPTMATGARMDLHIPLDAIRSVWSEGDGNWCVVMAGRLDDTTEGWLAYFPGKWD